MRLSEKITSGFGTQFGAKAVSFLLIAPAAVMGESFNEMNQATAGVKDVVKDTIAGVIWILSLLPIGIGFFAAMKMKEYLENKEENNQHEPRWMKFGKVVMAFGGGVMFTFMLFGILGKTFLGMDFGDTWQKLVVDFWHSVINNTNATNS